MKQIPSYVDPKQFADAPIDVIKVVKDLPIKSAPRSMRARDEDWALRGQHISPPPKDHPIYKGHLKPIADEEVRALRARVLEILAEPKYTQMAAFAELLAMTQKIYDHREVEGTAGRCFGPVCFAARGGRWPRRFGVPIYVDRHKAKHHIPKYRNQSAYLQEVSASP